MIRQRNLERLIRPEIRGNVAGFVEKYDLNESYIRQVLAGKPMGERAARNFEKKVGLSEGALDIADNALTPKDPMTAIEAALKQCDWVSPAYRKHFLAMLASMRDE